MLNKNKDIVLRFINAMGGGDVESAKECIDFDTFTLAKGFGSFSGVRTHDVILATIGAFKELMPSGMSPKILSVTGEQERVVVEFEGQGRLINGDDYCNEYCMVFTISKDKIIQVNEYFCTILAEEKLWPLINKLDL